MTTLNLNNLTDQPGRVLAVFVFGPLLVYKGVIYKDWFLIMFGILLIVWDMYWLLFKEPCVNKSTIKTCIK